MPPASRRPRSRQPELFPRSKRSIIEIAPNHRLVQITEEVDWTELEELVQAIRLSKLKSAAGRPPHLRALIGALMLRAMRYRALRDLEDLIRYYAPARFLYSWYWRRKEPRCPSSSTARGRAVSSYAAHEALRDCVHIRRANRRPDHLRADALGRAVERRTELVVAIPQQDGGSVPAPPPPARTLRSSR